MKTIKRMVAALLATLMLATSTSFVLAAEEYSKAEEVVVAKVNAAGIMTGTDKGFEPSKSLTRAEAAAIIVRMKGISESATKAAAGETLFTDVAASHWASGYVNQASKLGIVKGVSATEFAPDREVTIAEFTTMAVRALGAGQLVDAEGTWPNNYVNFANENGILDDVNSIHTAVAKRIEAATIVANTLEANMWAKKEVVTNGEITWKEVEGKTILNDVLKITPYDQKDGTYKAMTVAAEGTSNKDHTINGKLTVDDLDISSIKVGLTYDYWVNKDGKIIGFWETELAEYDKVNFTEIVKVKDDFSKVTLKVNDKEVEYKTTAALKESAEITVNEADAALEAAENVFGTAYIVDGKLAAIYGEKYETYAIVDEVKSKKVTFKDVDSAFTATSEITIDDDEYDYFFTKDGKSIDIKDLEKGDAIAFYAVDEKYVGKVLTNEVEGKVTATSDVKLTVKLDGTTYKVADETTIYDQIRCDQEIVAYLTEAGRIAMFDVVEEGVSDIAIIRTVRGIEDTYEDDNYEVTLFYVDGTKSEELVLDLAAIYKEFDLAEDADYKVGGTKSATTKEEGAYKYVTDKKYAVAGRPICYEVKGSKLTILKENSKAEYIKLDKFGQTPDYGSIVVKNNFAYITADKTKANLNDMVEVDKNTKFFKLKTDDYGVKVETLDFDSLDTTKLTADSYIADIKYDKNNKAEKAGIVIIGLGATINRTSDTNFAYVVDFSTNKTEKTIDVIMLNGDEASFTVDDDSDLYSKEVFTEDLVCCLIDLTVTDGKLVDVDVLAGTADDKYEDDELVYETVTGDAGKVAKYNSNKTLVTFKSGDSFALASDKLVLKYNEDKDEYTVASIDDVKKYSDDDKYIVTEMVTYTSDASDDDTEVVLIVFEEE